MKLNGNPRFYMPVPQNQSDEDEAVLQKETEIPVVKKLESPVKVTTVIHNPAKLYVNDDPKKGPMSVPRKIAFISSLILCVLFVVIFAWVLPCKISYGLGNFGRLTEEWTLVLQNTSLTSSVCLARRNSLGNQLLVFGYKKSNNQTEFSEIIALRNFDGKQLWRLPIFATPSHCICSELDINNDGIPECLFIGDNGFMVAIDIMTGSPLWYLHDHSNLQKPIFVTSPVVISDCDNDGVSELILTYTLQSGVINLAVVSGSMGKIIGPLFPLPSCKSISSLLSWKVHNSSTDVVFYCADDVMGEIWAISSQSICNFISSNSSDELNIQIAYSMPHPVSVTNLQAVPSIEGNNLLLLSGEEAILIKKNGYADYSVQWKIPSLDSSPFRSSVIGSFTSDNKEDMVVITQNNNFGSKLTGLNAVAGKELWSVILENSTVTALLLLPKIFGNRDGIIVKTVNSIPYSFTPLVKKSKVPHKTTKHDLESSIRKTLDVNLQTSKKNPNSSSQVQDISVLNNDNTNITNENDSIKKSDKETTDITKRIQIFEEKYILIKCGSTASLKVLISQQITSFCVCKDFQDLCCDPTVYSSKPTAVSSVVAEDKNLELIVLSSSIIPLRSTKVSQLQTVVKHLHLSGFLNNYRCTL